MAKSCLTENLKSASSRREELRRPLQPAERRQEEEGTSKPPLAESSEVSQELQAIFEQKNSSFSWKGSSYFGCSPPTRSDNGLVRDRVFGRCVPIASKKSFSPSTSSSALSTA